MKVRCRTNIDNYHCEAWPEEFCCRPMVGDAVRAKSGRILYIVCITHTTYMANQYDNDIPTTIRPLLLIELHKREAI